MTININKTHLLIVNYFSHINLLMIKKKNLFIK